MGGLTAEIVGERSRVLGGGVKNWVKNKQKMGKRLAGGVGAEYNGGNTAALKRH